MQRRVYDAIVIGAGHNGLCLAAYLQRAGLSTLVLERRHEEGGGVNTEEPVLAGFRHNLHGQYMEFFDVMPMIDDFGLDDLGLRTVMPEAQAGIVFPDDRPPIILHRPDLQERTHASIARYSSTDADRYVALKERAASLENAVAADLYSLPVARGLDVQGELLQAMFGDLGVLANFAYKTPRAVIDELFETPELRALLYRASVEWGAPLEEAGLGAMFVTFVMWTMANWKLTLGGTHTLAKAMTQACYREGVDLLENTAVESILVEDGRAVGVRARGTEYRAERLVASNADLHQTLLDLVGRDHLSERWVRRSEAYRYGPSHVLGTTTWCLRDAPAYRVAAVDPDIDRCFYTVVGFEGADDVLRYIRDAYSGRLPDRAAAGTWVNSLWDRSQAPAGHHAATGWFFLPKASELTADEWSDVRRSLNARLLTAWQKVAPNMTTDNVLAHRLYTPDQMEQKNLMREGDFSNGEFAFDQVGANRPFPEASNYRTEIDALYLCGPSAYPGGGVHAACGYNAFKAIAEDLRLASPVRAERGY